MAEKQNWSDQDEVTNPSMDAEVILKTGNNQFGRATVSSLVQTMARGGQAQFDDLFTNQPYYARGGGYYDIKAAYSREGGQLATKQGDLITYLPNLAPGSLGGPAKLISFALGSGAATTVTPLPLEFRRDVRYSSNAEDELFCEYRHDVPMMFPSAVYFEQLAAAVAGGEDPSSLLMNGLSVMAAAPGMDATKCPGLTIALLCSVVTAAFIEMGSQDILGSLGSGMGTFGFTPGVTVLTIDFAKVYAGDDTGVKAWRDGEPVSLATSISPGQTPEQILSQYLLPDGSILLGGAGTLCLAVQKMLLLTRSIADEEALAITAGFTATMHAADESYVPPEEVCTIHGPAPIHLVRVRLEHPIGELVYEWPLDYDMPGSVIAGLDADEVAEAIGAWLISTHNVDMETMVMGKVQELGILPPLAIILDVISQGEEQALTLVQDTSEPQISLGAVKMWNADGTNLLSEWWIGGNASPSFVEGTPEEVLERLMPFIDVVASVNATLSMLGMTHSQRVELTYQDAYGVDQIFLLLSEYEGPALPVTAVRFYMMSEDGSSIFAERSWGGGNNSQLPADILAEGAVAVAHWVDTAGYWMMPDGTTLDWVRGVLSSYAMAMTPAVILEYTDSEGTKTLTLYENVYPE